MLLEFCILVFINIHSKNQKIQTVSDILPPVQCSYSCLNHPFLLIGYITNDTYFNIFVLPGSLTVNAAHWPVALAAGAETYRSLVALMGQLETN